MIKCPYCDKEFKNTKALGSHISYIHKFENILLPKAYAMKVSFEVEWIWEGKKLVIICPSLEVREFISFAIREKC
ncbi:unnamed protein product, partial [marine sediment metagenome]